MDREEPEESSSSQNVNLSIASLQKRSSGRETITVSLSDGSSFFIPLPLPEGWAAGYVLEEEEYQHLKEEDSYVRGKEWAASRLASREDSSGRMVQKLMQREYSSSVARRIVSDLTDLGFLDDARFAEIWIRERLRSHPEGPDALLAGLLNRGVPSGTAKEVIAESVTPDDVDWALERAIAKVSTPSVTTGEAPEELSDKQIRTLMRRGFSYNSIKKKLNRDNGS